MSTHAHDDPSVVAAAPSWSDSKRYAWLLGLAVPMLPLVAWGLVEATGLGLLWWFGPMFVFGFMPLLDTIVGTDPSNPPESVVKWLEQDRYYRWCTFLFIPLQYVSLVFACVMWASGSLSMLESVGLAFTVGSVNGIAIANAHELGHKRERHERWLAKIALAPTWYGHFFIEHNRGHHVRVSTPEDPASSRLGENFYEFLPRTILGSLRSAWELEKVRFDRMERSPWSISNDILNAWLMSLVLWVVLVVAFGPVILPYLVIQALFGFSLLEVVNYVEHYGLLRQKREDGRYVRTEPEHSWNSNIVASNVFLYHLQRHSDHHAHPLRRYQALRHHDEAPELPAGYATMIVAAYLPPVWKRVMDHRVVAHYGGDVMLANIHPRTRKRILKRWARGGSPAAAAA
jgi:alkane 1-monooxygenase